MFDAFVAKTVVLALTAPSPAPLPTIPTNGKVPAPVDNLMRNSVATGLTIFGGIAFLVTGWLALSLLGGKKNGGRVILGAVITICFLAPAGVLVFGQGVFNGLNG